MSDDRSVGATVLGAALALLLSDSLMFGLAWANSPPKPAPPTAADGEERERPCGLASHPTRSYAGELPHSGQDRHPPAAPLSEEEACHYRGTVETALRAMLAPITGLLWGLDAAQVRGGELLPAGARAILTRRVLKHIWPKQRLLRHILHPYPLFLQGFCIRQEESHTSCPSLFYARAVNPAPFGGKR